MEHKQELLALILPPQGRLAVAHSDSAGLLDGPGLVIAVEHKGPLGSQTVAGLLDRQRVETLRDALTLWLRIVDRGDVEARPDVTVDDGWAKPSRPPVLAPDPDDGDVIVEGTVAQWLASDVDRWDT